MHVLLAGLSNDQVELNLARHLAAAGVHLFILAVTGSKAEAMCRDAGIPFASDEFRNRADRRSVALIRELHATHTFDLFHCLTNRALSTALLALRKVNPRPAVLAYRGTMGHLSWFDPGSHLTYLNRRLDSISCVSGAVRDYLRRFRIPEHKLAVIWKGHDPAWYSAAPRERLREFGIPDNATVACFTGNIRPVKGIHYLLKAFASITREDNLHLLIIGDVRDPRIRKKISGNPLVHFTGFRPDASSLAGACDIAVMPSIEREGLPKAVLESMAQGVPPIVTRVGGLPELVLDGSCGLVIPPKDADAILSALRKLAGNPALRRSLGAAARARVEGDFHFRHTVEKTLALYERLLSAPRA